MDRRPLGRIREVAQVDVSLAAWEIPLLAAGVHSAARYGGREDRSVQSVFRASDLRTG